MSAKKTVPKKVVAKKPTPAKKSAVVKKPAVVKKLAASAKKKTPAAKASAPKKKPATPAKAAAKPAAKKPVAKPSAKVAAKKSAAKRAEVKKTPVQPQAPAKPKKDFVRKPLTVVKKPVPRVPLKKPEEAVAFENQSKSFAFSFAEQMKKRQRAEDERQREENTEIRLSRRPTTRTKGGESQQFPAADLAMFRKRLIMLRQEALGQSASLRTSALEQTDDRSSEDDDGSDVFMRLQNLSQVDSHNKVIQKIDEALQRIGDGTYGICEVCGQLIRKPRLMNLPFVHTCMECQREMESRGGR